jgi:hypothetical protein
LGASCRINAQSIYFDPAIISFVSEVLRCGFPAKAAAVHPAHQNAMKNLLEFLLAFLVARELDNRFPPTGVERGVEVTVD